MTGLQPCEKSTCGRYGFHSRIREFERECENYYKSENTFHAECLPLLSLKTLCLGFDLSHIRDNEEIDNRIEYSPQASWLNKFLRLPLEQIDLEFGDVEFKDKFGSIPNVEGLIDALNHVDGQTRIRAKCEWSDSFKPRITYEDLHPEEAARYEKMRGEPIYAFNNIWA